MEKNNGTSVKNEIMEAFMKLMSEKLYMEITVTDIINKSGVARASFYRNFSSVNDVIDAVADELSDNMIDKILPGLAGTDERKLRELLFHHFYRFIRKQREVGAIRHENLPVLFSRLELILENKEVNFPSETITEKYNNVGKIGLVSSITRKWLATGTKESPEEMIDYIMSFITLF